MLRTLPLVFNLLLVSSETLAESAGELATGMFANSAVSEEIAATSRPLVHEYAAKILVQDDGMFLVAGTSHSSALMRSTFFIYRFEESGEPDLDFGSGGLFESAGEGISGLTGLALQSDGKIVIAGYAHNGTDLDAVLLRVTDNGALDPSFGDAGIVRTNAGSDEIAYSMEIGSDDEILVGGTASTELGGSRKFMLARYGAGGTLDTQFGTGGIVLSPSPIGLGIERFPSFRVVAIEPDGSILAVGGIDVLYQTSTSPYLALARYSPEGQLDDSFAENGMAVDISSDAINDMAVQPDGKIVWTLRNAIPSGNQRTRFVVNRLNPDASYDQTFQRTSLDISGENYSYSVALAVQNDGEILVAGQTREDGLYCQAIARLHTDGSLDLTFGDSGSSVACTGTLTSHATDLVIRGDYALTVGESRNEQPSTGTSIVRHSLVPEPSSATLGMAAVAAVSMLLRCRTRGRSTSARSARTR